MKNSANLDQIPLRWDEFQWRGELDIPLMGQASNPDVGINVNTQDEEQIEPCEKQIETWRRFVDRSDKIFQTILESAFSYYTRMRPQYAKAGPEWIANMPEITEPAQLIEMISLSSITVTWPYDDNPVQIGIQFGCGWDHEHGFGVVIEDDKVVDVGSADCAIL